VFRPGSALFFAVNFVVPILIFGVLGIRYLHGFHWAIGFYVFAVMALASLHGTDSFKRVVAPLAVFAGIHAIVFVFLLAQPLEFWKSRVNGPARFREFVMHFKTSELVADALRETRAGLGVDTLMADGYTLSSMLSVRTGRIVPVFGGGTRFGRNDDFATDFRDYAGQDFGILSHHERHVSEFTEYFQSVELRILKIADTEFRLILGRGFQFERYREQVLKRAILDTYVLPGACPVREKYGLQDQ
jgi:hypothetical protein